MNTEYNPTEYNPMDPALEQAVSEIRDEAPDSAVIEAAAARVWANLLVEANAEANAHALHSIRGCADFQALIPGFKAGRLPQARAMLLKDHLHECVDCRRIYEGRVIGMPAQGGPRRNTHRNTNTVRWAVAAVVVAAAGLSVWVAVDQYDQFGTHTGRAFVQTVNGTLYEILPSGIHPLAAGQDLRDGIEIRTGKDSDAMLELRDGSVVELRERSGFSTTQTAGDLTIRLDRGSVIVQAAKRRSSHLYVATADCRVAVTGTLFSVSAGLKGSRVSVIEGEVRVSQNGSQNGSQDGGSQRNDQVLHPGDQAVTSPNLEPVSVKDDIAWSRNRDRMVKQLELLRAGLAQLHLPELRYSSRLLDRLPASTVFFASIPNLAAYLGQAQGVFRQKMAESPELRAWWAGHGIDVEPVMERLRAASEYLGDEIVIAGFSGPDGKMQMPVFLAEVKRAGFAEFLQKEGAPLAMETRNGVVVFSPNRAAVLAFAPTLDAAAGGFPGTPFHARIADSYRDGAGLLLCADLSQMAKMGSNRTLAGARYFIAEEKEVNRKMEARLSIGFDGPRTGIASWLASPSSMGALDYVSPEATLVTAFVVKNPSAIVDELLAVHQRSAAAAEKALADARQQTGIDVRNDLAASMGGEFSLSLDGPAFPVPSWKLVTEVYDPLRMQATLQKLVETYNQKAVKAGDKPLRTSQEVVEGRTYYMIAGADPNPLTEAHYTFADGYLIAGPTRALVGRALQVKSVGTSITHSANFVAMVPRDHYANFSALIYQNLGATLAPVIGLLGAFAPPGLAGRPGQPNPLQGLGNMKPTLIAAYGEPDRINVATSGDLMGMSLTNLMTGNLQGALPFSQFMGTRGREPAFK